jgi:hypothetical protein
MLLLPELKPPKLAAVLASHVELNVVKVPLFIPRYLMINYLIRPELEAPYTL